MAGLEACGAGVGYKKIRDEFRHAKQIATDWGASPGARPADRSAAIAFGGRPFLRVSGILRDPSIEFSKWEADQRHLWFYPDADEDPGDCASDAFVGDVGWR